MLVFAEVVPPCTQTCIARSAYRAIGVAMVLVGGIVLNIARSLDNVFIINHEISSVMQIAFSDTRRLPLGSNAASIGLIS